MKYTPFIFLSCLLPTAFTSAQVYLGSNGLTVSGTGTSTEIKLGGTLNQHTDIDLNSVYNLNFKSGSTGYLSILGNGNISLGNTTDDGNKLQVFGNASFYNSAATGGAGGIMIKQNSVATGGYGLMEIAGTSSAWTTGMGFTFMNHIPEVRIGGTLYGSGNIGAKSGWFGTDGVAGTSNTLILTADATNAYITSMKYASSPYPDTYISAPDIYFNTKTGAGWPDGSTGAYGTTRMAITQAGNVGIGITTPTANLQINSPTIANRTSGPYQFAISDGSLNRFYIVHDVGATRLSLVSPSGAIESSMEGSESGYSLYSPKSITLQTGQGYSLGYNASYHLFYIDGTESARMSAAGFGIGTTNPAAPLHVAPVNQYTSLGGTPAFLIYGPTTTANIAMGVSGSWGTSNIIQSRDGNASVWQLSLNPFGGNVGVGTNTPAAKLHIQSPGGFGTGLMVESTLPTAYSSIDFKNSAGELNQMTMTGPTFSNGIFNGSSASWGTNGSGGLNIVSYNQAGGVIRFATGGADVSNERMRITTDGNILIGTTIQQGKLAVNGDIYAKKVKVTQNGWADYVFDKNYHLPTLAEVEQYIQQHKHLQDMPSAAAVEKDGVDLGDNQATLLKKVEELTLYVIEQNKMIEQQQKRIEALEKKDP